MYRGPLPALARVVNGAVEGVDAKLALHVCFGNLYGRPSPAARSYRHLFPALQEVRATQLLLEFANRGIAEADLWREFPTDKELGAGAREKLWLSADCWFWETPRWICRQKLAALVERARQVRRELGG